jgi:hypothetical protein
MREEAKRGEVQFPGTAPFCLPVALAQPTGSGFTPIPAGPDDSHFLLVPPDLRREMRVCRRCELRGSEQVIARHLIAGFENALPEIEYPAIRHNHQNATARGAVQQDECFEWIQNVSSQQLDVRPL